MSRTSSRAATSPCASYTAATSASAASARTLVCSRSVPSFAPRPSATHGPRSTRRAQAARASPLTRALLIRVSLPSSASACSAESISLTHRPRTASPRNSSLWLSAAALSFPKLGCVSASSNRGIGSGRPTTDSICFRSRSRASASYSTSFIRSSPYYTGAVPPGSKDGLLVPLSSCPFCREMFPAGERQRCPVCGVHLVATDTLAPSDDAYSEDGLPRQPEWEPLGPLFLGRGRGALALLALCGIVAFFL